MSNIQQQRRYSLIAAYIDGFISDMVSDRDTDMKFSDPADRQILDLLVAAQMKALDLAISFEDKIKENT